MDFKTCTRNEWEVYQADHQERTHTHGFDPGMPWHVATWRERFGILSFYAFMWGVIFPASMTAAIVSTLKMEPGS